MLRIGVRFGLLALLFLVPAAARAHGGGLDTHGCHHDRKAGGYHCHRGPLAGRSFSSREEMLKTREAVKPRQAEKSKPKE
ncbi:MAG TPA: YHYH domain-containing protein [candidate division Zixibacteria bacterium]|nr:YHYH domain-containing protein [candidate division Zixibacteria bacterium]